MTRAASLLFVAILILTLIAPERAFAQAGEVASIDSSVLVFEGEVKHLEFLGSNQGQNVHKAQIKVSRVLHGPCPERIEILITNPMELDKEQQEQLRTLGLGEIGRFKARLLLTENGEEVHQLIGAKDDYQQLAPPREPMPPPWPLIRQGKGDKPQGAEAREGWLTLIYSLGSATFLLFMLCSLHWYRQGSQTSASPLREDRVREQAPSDAAIESESTEPDSAVS